MKIIPYSTLVASLLSSFAIADLLDSANNQMGGGHSQESSQNVDDENVRKVNLGRSVVSASGYEQDIKDAPASIAIIPREEILTRPIRDLGDAVQDIPGVYVEAGKTGGNTISMRGLGSAYTLILIDGKRQNVAQGFDANGFNGTFTSFMPPASMIERIEVIRGPASIIYGSDAMGGVINIITKKHSDRFSGGIQLETTLSQHPQTFGPQYGINGYMNIPLIKEMLSLNLRGAYKWGGQNAFYEPGKGPHTPITYTSGNNGSVNFSNPYYNWSATGYTQWNAGGRLNFTPNKNNYIYLDSEVFFARTGSLKTSSSSITAVRDFYKFNNVLSHTADYDWGKINSYIQYSQTQWASHADTNSTWGSGLWPGSSKGNTVDWANGRYNRDLIFQSTFTDDFDFGRAGSLIFNGGVYYIWQQLYTKNNGFRRDMNQVALFAEGEYLINQYFSTTLGLRYNYSDIFKAIPNPRFYVNYNPTDWLTFKAGIATGVLVPQLSYLYEGYTLSTDRGNNNTTTASYGNKNLKPEQSVSYELSAILDTEPAMLILTGFYTDFNNKISSVTGIQPGTTIDGVLCDAAGANQCAFYRNLDSAMLTGAETSFKLKPIYGISLDASYGFTYSRTLSVSNANQEFLVGEPINNIPKHKFTIKPNYHYKNFDAYIRWSGNFQTPTSAVQQSSLATSARGLVGKYYKDYQLVDIAATYKFNKTYALTFAVNNLLDVKFYDPDNLITYSSGRGGTSYINPYQRILPARAYWISFRADWNPPPRYPIYY
ncbi:TonB-dependent receptor domain-containing protein [uncultured Helicobacter sp.]|uniref:TonB-dependent receptor domain-containing protein n=1 Tax=uncultured Helicobacter sp. TaxID=175537 RepID=UPI00272CC1BB|nr:TonB-dependent receptor [uncultured Helicobacter sp.]